MEQSLTRSDGSSLAGLERRLLRQLNKAVRDFDLIAEGDRIVVAASGGKDSLSLLHLLLRRQRRTFDAVAVHVQSDFACAGCAHRDTLAALFRQWGVEYAFEEIQVMDGQRPPNCFWCSWNRRKALFLAAQRLGCNKVAFGHHADDVAQTTLLNLFYHGRLETMEPRVVFFDGVITVIRPLVYVAERDLARFAGASGFPSQLCRCPNSRTGQRARMRELLEAIEAECPPAKANLLKAALKCLAKFDLPAARASQTSLPATHDSRGLLTARLSVRPSSRRGLAEVRG